MSSVTMDKENARLISSYDWVVKDAAVKDDGLRGERFEKKILLK